MVDAVAGILEGQGQPRGRRRTRGSGERLALQNLPELGTWAEVVLESEILRLRGRVDIVEKSNDRTTLRDLKTGRISETDGSLLPAILLQMRLYGLVALEAERSREVVLVVDNGRDHRVDFNHDDIEETKAWLQSMLSQLPSGFTDARPLARPGGACLHCPHRHVCPGYLTEAPKWRASDADYAPPQDVWGEIVEMQAEGDAGSLELRDDSGRLVRVAGVPRDQLLDLDIGMKIYLFGLHGRPRRTPDGRWRSPSTQPPVATPRGTTLGHSQYFLTRRGFGKPLCS